MKIYNVAKKFNLSKVVLLCGILFVGVALGVLFGDNIKYSLLLRNNSNTSLPTNLNYAEVEQVYDALRTNFDGELNLDNLITGLKDGLARASGDEYTEFLDNEEKEEFDEDLNGSFTGIGAQLQKRDKNIMVEVPLTGYPAEKTGLRARDVIVEIDGESAYDISLKKAVEKIRGEEGTIVKLKIVRDDNQLLEFDVRREKITIPSVESKIIEGDIGYMKLTRFGDDTMKLSRQVAEEFSKAGVKGVILDLRNNPGGLLPASVDVAGLWVSPGKTVLEQRQGNRTTKVFESDGDGILSNVPTVILINEGSASASEIVAGALKDHKLATLIGEKSYGKGSVQQLIDFADGTILKVTIARWYTPNGKNIDKEGIEPDQKVERTDEDYKNDRDPQKEAAINFLKK